jgi:hypothetical protein
VRLLVKASLLVKGCTQVEGIDYGEVFAPVAPWNLLSQGGAEDLQIEVKIAFLNGPLEEETYMEAIKGYDIGDKELRLKRALYGLKQSARAWNQKLVSVLQEQGFKVSETSGRWHQRHTLSTCRSVKTGRRRPYC